MTIRTSIHIFLNVVALLITSCLAQSDPYTRGNFALESENYSQAIHYYRLALEKDPADHRARNNLGVAYLRSRQYEEAFKEFQKIIAVEPGNPKVHFNLALVYYAQGLPEQEIQEYQNTLQLDPEHFAAHLNLGHAYLAQDQVELARKEYEWVLERDPNHIQVIYNLAMIHKEHQRKAEAISLLERYLNLDSNSVWTDKANRLLEELRGIPIQNQP